MKTQLVPAKRMPQGASKKRAVKLTPLQIRLRTFARAIKLLAARPRSVAELRDLLLKGRHTNKNAVEEAIARLKEYGYLDDERFAIGFAFLKIRQKPVGRQRLKRDLTLKKVGRAITDEALEVVYSEVSEDELIDQAIEKHLRIRGRPASLADAKRLFDHLMRRGFPFELVSEKVRRITRGGIEESD